MTQTQAESDNQLYTHNILAAAKAIWRWPNELQNTKTGQGITFSIPKVMIEIISFNSGTREKRVFVKDIVSFKKEEFRLNFL